MAESRVMRHQHAVLAATLAREWDGSVFWLTLGAGPDESLPSVVRRLARFAVARPGTGTTILPGEEGCRWS